MIVPINNQISFGSVHDLDPFYLENQGITHILQLSDGSPNLGNRYPLQRYIFQFREENIGVPEAKYMLQKMALLLQQYCQNPYHKVLVICNSGTYKSALICLSYMVIIQKMDLNRCVAYIRSKNPDCLKDTSRLAFRVLMGYDLNNKTPAINEVDIYNRIYRVG